VEILFRRGFGLVTGFIDHLYTKLRTTSNYSSIANHHTLQSPQHRLSLFQPAMSSQAVPWQRLLTVGHSSASALKSSPNACSLPANYFLHRLPYRTDVFAPVISLITPRHGPRRQHRSFTYANRFRGNVFTEPFLRICHLFLLIKNLLPNGHRCVVCFAAVA
jgi:hypothetical protein